MLTIGNIRYNLKKSNVREVSEDTGVSYNTLINLASGTNKNPTYNIVKLLTEYFSIGQQK